jgi:hypothetical protein
MFASGPSVGRSAIAASGASPGDSAVPGVNSPSVTLVASSGRSKPTEYPVSGSSPTTRSRTTWLPSEASFSIRRSLPPLGSV